MEPEEIYVSPYRPDPASALDVLAFVLTPVEAFVAGNAEERWGAANVLYAAKCEAIERWQSLQPRRSR